MIAEMAWLSDDRAGAASDRTDIYLNDRLAARLPFTPLPLEWISLAHMSCLYPIRFPN